MAATRMLARRRQFSAVMTKDRILPDQGGAPRFRLMAELANGGFSQVWMARDLKSTTRPYVAVKCCRGTTSVPLAGNTEDEVWMLRKLTRDLLRGNRSHLGADNILTWVDDFVITEPGPPVLYHQCIVTELVVPLSDEFLDIRDTAPLMRQLVDAMHFLHDHGIVHGDPHPGNIGIAVEGIKQVSEQDMRKALNDDVALVSALEDIEDGDGTDCHDLVPKDARTAQLILYDFGRAYEASKDNLRGTPPHELMGDNPAACRSPEVDMYRLSEGAVGVHWSFGCDVWALRSILFKLARPALDFVPIYGEHRTEAYRVVQRCLPGGAPPRAWLDYCDMGPAVLSCLQEKNAHKGSSNSSSSSISSRNSNNSKTDDETVYDKDWVLREMARLSDEFWQGKATRRSWEDRSFPLREFCCMVRGMMLLEPTKRATMAAVVQHEFWVKYDGIRKADTAVTG